VLLDKDFLRVTEKEAKELSDGFFDKEQLADMLKTSEGAFELFSITLNQQRSVPVPLRPTPEGLITPPSVEEVTVDPHALIDALINRKRWMEAFETAVRHAPQRVPEVMEEAGHIYHERGLHKRLWQLLLQLPEDLEPDESILFCKLQAAFRINESESVRKDVEAFLEVHEAPRLRALYAGVFAFLEISLENAKRAYFNLKTPTTLYIYGHLLMINRLDVQLSLEILAESVRLAKLEGKNYDVIRNTTRYADALSFFGNYKESFYQTKFALEAFYHHGLGDWQRYLELVNNFCYYQLLTGSEQGVFEQLTENEETLSGVNSDLAYLYRSTLGDYFLASGQPEKALTYYKADFDASRRESIPDSLLEIVSALLASKNYEQALQFSEEMYFLSQKLDDSKQLAKLCYGLALSMTEASKSTSLLEESYQFYDSLPVALRCAKISLFLAKAYLCMNDKKNALQTLAKAKPYISELSETGLHLLSGPPDAFEEVWTLLRMEQPYLYIKCLGTPEVRVEGKELSIPLRWLEIVVLLASRPQGLSGEQLMLLLYEDEGNLTTLKATLSKIRQYIPLSSRIYRIDAEYKADFLQVNTLLDNGQVAEALELYEGQLLPKSDVVSVRELREMLDERMRQAVLKAKDYVLFEKFAIHNQDDLEILDGWLQAMPQGHPKISSVRASIRRTELQK
jgi:hypothetical protein